jgi:hypothetical protein
VHELRCRGVADRAAKSQIIPQCPVLKAARTEDDHGLVLNHQPRSRQRRALNAQSITELEGLAHDSGKSTDADQDTLNASGRRLTLSECFAGHFHQTLGDG